MLSVFFYRMKSSEQNLRETLLELTHTRINICLEMGEHTRKKGEIEASLFWYQNGFELAKKIKDRPRIQQFSNLLCSLNYLKIS